WLQYIELEVVLVPDSLSEEARDFIFQFFHVNPGDRPTATQLLDHPFVR
ncbi:mitogen-activated protein kinase kinase kinase 1-like protein, partial [Tanacetum coccineum]